MTSGKMIEALLKKGVKIPVPETVEIGAEVSPERISGEGVVIHPGCRISGSSTLISKGCRIGTDGPATVRDCLLGPEVKLGSGTFAGAVFLKGANAGPNSQIREGCLLEEEAGCAHCVGLKQTILMSFVTLGSLINFCDCLMAGGTSRRDHSEVGSSFIHFNYTPNQDKATASLIGDVPRGVMLNQPPIFLGGQGGIAGPVRLGFGVVSAAGTVLRRDCPEDNRLLAEGKPRPASIPFTRGAYRSIRRKLHNNILYIANLAALRRWYLDIRVLFIGEDFPEELWKGAVGVLEAAREERIKRLNQLAEKMPASARLLKDSDEDFSRSAAEQEEFHRGRPEMEKALRDGFEDAGEAALAGPCIEKVKEGIGSLGPDYVRVIQGLSPEVSARGTRWLQGIVDKITDAALRPLPSLARIIDNPGA